MSSDFLEIRMPRVGSTNRGVVDEWFVEANAEIKKGQPLLVIETEEVYFEIPSPEHGYFLGQVIHAGEAVTTEAVLGLIVTSKRLSIETSGEADAYLQALRDRRTDFLVAGNDQRRTVIRPMQESWFKRDVFADLDVWLMALVVALGSWSLWLEASALIGSGTRESNSGTFSASIILLLAAVKVFIHRFVDK